jgi:hypothetical protein
MILAGFHTEGTLNGDLIFLAFFLDESVQIIYYLTAAFYIAGTSNTNLNVYHNYSPLNSCEW